MQITGTDRMEPFKNVFSPRLVACLADHLQKHLRDFDRPAFERPVLADLEALELKQRVQLIADHLHLALPTNHKKRARTLMGMLHPDAFDHTDQPSDAEGICGWGIMPLTRVVGQHGLDDFEGSLDLLKEMTKRFSAEFDIRYFLQADQDRALTVMRGWIDDPNRHVRRLVSEGTRPRLPWGIQLNGLMQDPAPVLPILTALRDDPEDYVRRSVANNLNDIAKTFPDLVAELAHDWLQDAGKERQKLVRHACRSLIKAGHPGALEAFGLGAPKISLEALTIASRKVRFGGTLDFSAELRSTGKQDQSLVIDYVVHFLKANGQRAGKVFKWKTLTLPPGETLSLARSHPIRPITTRRYYEGTQAVSLRINGQDHGYVEFELLVPGGDSGKGA